jgi:hypothetical protein
MPVLNDDTVAVLDDLRKLIAKCETLVARGRHKPMNSAPQARSPRTILETTLRLLKNTPARFSKQSRRMKGVGPIKPVTVGNPLH